MASKRLSRRVDEIIRDAQFSVALDEFALVDDPIMESLLRENEPEDTALETAVYPELAEFPEFLYDNSNIEDEVYERFLFDEGEEPLEWDSGDEVIDSPSFLSKLRTWASSGVSFAKVDEMLGILAQEGLEVPLSYKTLLKSQSSATIEKMGSGKFAYFGLKESERLLINIDGLPLYKSSAIGFWTILGKDLSVVNSKPHLIAAFCGVGKPPVNDFLAKFVRETNEKKTECNFLCDSPAVAFTKGCSGHTSKSGCTKCSAKGGYGHQRVFYRATTGEPRTDMSYRQKVDPSHHVSDTPVLQMENIDLVKSFRLDWMHVVYIGVTKKLIKSAVNHEQNETVR